MLTEYELASCDKAGSGQGKLAELGVEFAVGATEEAETGDHMTHQIWGLSKDSPPVAGGACCRARLCHRVPATKESVIDGQHRFGCLASRDLFGARHVRTVGADFGHDERDSRDTDR